MIAYEPGSLGWEWGWDNRPVVYHASSVNLYKSGFTPNFLQSAQSAFYVPNKSSKDFAAFVRASSS